MSLYNIQYTVQLYQYNDNIPSVHIYRYVCHHCIDIILHHFVNVIMNNLPSIHNKYNFEVDICTQSMVDITFLICLVKKYIQYYFRVKFWKSLLTLTTQKNSIIICNPIYITHIYIYRYIINTLFDNNYVLSDAHTFRT